MLEEQEPGTMAGAVAEPASTQHRARTRLTDLDETTEPG